MEKQTAVEWLVQQLPLIQQEGLRDNIEQAKEMEKQQIIDAWQRGFDWGQSLAEQGHETTLIDAKHYYNETYGKAN